MKTTGFYDTWEDGIRHIKRTLNLQNTSYCISFKWNSAIKEANTLRNVDIEHTNTPHKQLLTLPGVLFHDDVIKWKHFQCYWPFVWGIHRWPVNSPHKGQWRMALMFSLICAWISGWVNNREAGDLRRYRAHYDVTVMPEIVATVTGYAEISHVLYIKEWMQSTRCYGYWQIHHINNSFIVNQVWIVDV